MTKVLVSESYLEDIADAIRDKNSSSDTYTLSEMAQAIEDIPTGGGGDIAHPEFVTFREYNGNSLDISWLRTDNMTSMNQMFNNASRIATLDVSNFDTSRVTNMSAMFNATTALTELDVSSFNTSNVTNMSRMFYGGSSLNQSLEKIAGLNSFYTPKVTDVSSFVYNRGGINTKIDLSNATFDLCTNFSSMFQNCRNVPEIDLSSANSSVASYNCNMMFSNCANVQKIDMRNFDFTKANSKTNMFSGVPNGCLIIVKDDTQKTWFSTNFSNLTNVKTVAEYEAE